MSTVETVLPVGDVELCVVTCGSPSDPTVLLIGTTAATWHDELVGQLTGRFVIRYDLPAHSPAIMAHFGSAPPVDWSDRTSILDGAVATARVFSGSPLFDAAEARAHAAGILDRSGPHPASARNGLMATVFAKLDCTPRWRERLTEITAPTLVVHGAADRFFPVGNAQALAREIPGASLMILDGVGAELPRRAHAEVGAAVLAYTAP